MRILLKRKYNLGGNKMRIRIDLKIFIFFILFFITKQIQIYLTILFFCILHEFGHIVAGIILKMKPENVEIMPYGVTVVFKVNPEDVNKKIRKRNSFRNKKDSRSISRTYSKSNVCNYIYIYRSNNYNKTRCCIF